jgi:hypothetical protein
MISFENKIENMSITGENNLNRRLNMDLTSASNGKLIMQLPRALIDSRSDRYSPYKTLRDDLFFICKNEHNCISDSSLEIGNSTDWRALGFDFPRGTTKITISR